MRIGRALSIIGLFTGLRYLTDLAMDFLGSHPTWFFGYAESAAWQYTRRQTHRPRCAYCDWMIAPWPRHRHDYCDEQMAEQNGDRHYDTAGIPGA